MVAREYTISWGENKPIVCVCVLIKKTHKLNAGPADTGHARQKMGRVYAAPKPSMHRPFKKKILIKKTLNKKNQKNQKIF